MIDGKKIGSAKCAMDENRRASIALKLHHIRKSIEQIEADKDAFVNLLHLARSQSRPSASRYIM